MGGFECADQINRSGNRVDLQRETEHDIRVIEDYRLLDNLGMKVVREGICWSRVEKAPYIFDFSHLVPFYEAAEKLEFQIIWDLCHFGYPDGLIPTHPNFVSRFVALCAAFAEFHRRQTNQELFVVPINEISFLSWHSGDVRGTVPFAINSGDDIKYHLCKAAIQGMKVLKEILPNCVIFAVDPLIKIHAANYDITREELALMNLNQFKAIDILLGNHMPELEGDPSLIDVIGLNYYYNNQWNHNNAPIRWPEESHLLTPFSHLLQMSYQHYFKPIVLTETGHFGVGRDRWIKEITKECIKAKNQGVDLRGLCIYPIIDRPDWDDLGIYSQSGIWDFDENKNRIADQVYYDACVESIELIEQSFPTTRNAHGTLEYSEKRVNSNKSRI